MNTTNFVLRFNTNRSPLFMMRIAVVIILANLFIACSSNSKENIVSNNDLKQPAPHKIAIVNASSTVINSLILILRNLHVLKLKIKKP